jgi:hypothetical protein
MNNKLKKFSIFFFVAIFASLIRTRRQYRIWIRNTMQNDKLLHTYSEREVLRILVNQEGTSTTILKQKTFFNHGKKDRI